MQQLYLPFAPSALARRLRTLKRPPLRHPPARATARCAVCEDGPGVQLCAACSADPANVDWSSANWFTVAGPLEHAPAVFEPVLPRVRRGPREAPAGLTAQEMCDLIDRAWLTASVARQVRGDWHALEQHADGAPRAFVAGELGFGCQLALPGVA